MAPVIAPTIPRTRRPPTFNPRHFIVEALGSVVGEMNEASSFCAALPSLNMQNSMG
jgi:hypothetical protein